MQKKAFSFVEIIIVITLIALLGVIGASINMSYQEKSLNSKLTSELETIENALVSYEQAEKTLPLPWGNKNYFSATGSYEHDETDAFWVHGFITQDTVPNKYLNFLPLDPKTGQYYAYGKSFDRNQFEIAWVIYEDNTPQTKLLWNYDGIGGPYSLIREYNGPEFLRENSRQFFPYNPTERILTAHIASYSGTINIKNINGQDINTPEEIFSYSLRKWDNLRVDAWWYAEVYYSDGSASRIGEDTEIVFANMDYKEENNLITKIQLVLKAGAIWTKASRLDESSQFEVYTTDITAAVRGTIFGVTKNLASTNVTVLEGEVEVEKNSAWTEKNLIEELEENGELISWEEPVYVSWWFPEFMYSSDESYISVEAWKSPFGITLWERTSAEEETLDTPPNLDNLNQAQPSTINDGIDPISSNTSIDCQYSFMLDGQCVENNLSDRWWTLVAYAPFEKDTQLHFKDVNWNLANNEWIQNGTLGFQSGGVFVEDGTLSYNISKFDLGDNFAIEAEVKGEDLNSYTSTIPAFLYSLKNNNAGEKIETGLQNIGWANNIYYINYSISESNYSNFSSNINWIDITRNYNITTFVEWNSIGISQDNNTILKKRTNNFFQSPQELFVGRTINDSSDLRWNEWIYSLKIYKK